MSDSLPQYSTLFQCRYDEQLAGRNGHFHYSVFRAVDARDVEQKPTVLPHVHDFAVIWDDDHDTRIIHVLEEMLMVGMLPGVQFIGEHKGELTVILAARTYWEIDVDAYTTKLRNIAFLSAGDAWIIEVGMYDHSPGNLRIGHQCEFKNLLGLSAEETHANLFSIDSRWCLGTKQWIAVDAPKTPTSTLEFFSRSNRYKLMGHRPATGLGWINNGEAPGGGAVHIPPPPSISGKSRES